ncbi:carboxypeptidase-like regulatory domain-containing protein [Vacuolonema iberomarrocanum]|uniref:carboxypeptidase-like regulatory domain-containing protein n=1 Tax=Vacuolonema iberomarrocanum TaxID=3454632 RepID=UPI003F6DA9F0
MKGQPIIWQRIRWQRIRWQHLGALLPLVLLGMAERAIAHGVVLEYNATQAYEVTAAYDTGTPMAEAQVAVFSPDNPSEPWMTGTTDAEGRFLFTPPSPGNWEVQVRQAGHGDLVVIAVEGEAIAAAPTAESGSPSTEATDTTDTPGVDTETAMESPATTLTPGESSNSGSSSPSITGLQRGLMAGSVVWGFVGTALFFSQRNPTTKR